MARTHRPLTVLALLLSMFMSAMEATVVGTAMPTVIAELGGLERYGWVGAAYLLASTVSVPLYGKVADLLGRRPVLLFGIALFLAGSIASGFARSLELLIVARAFQGLGAGAMQPVTLTVVGDLFTLEQRGRIQGLFGAVWAASGIAGPLVGGLIVAHLAWPWVFWINVPFGLIAMTLLVRYFHEAKFERLRAPLDHRGSVLLSVGALLLLLGASREYALLTLPLGLASLFAFIHVERRAADPVLPPSLLVERSIGVAALSSALLGATMMALLTYVPLYAQAVLHRVPTEAGAAVAPMLIGWPIAATFTSRLLVRTGFRRPVLIGSGLCAVALVAFALWVPLSRSSLFELQASMFCYGLGMGLTNSALVIGVQSQVAWNQRGVATALVMFSRSMGGALGVGALGAVIAAHLGADVHAINEADALRGPLQLIFWAIALLSLANVFAVAFYPRERVAVAPA